MRLKLERLTYNLVQVGTMMMYSPGNP